MQPEAEDDSQMILVIADIGIERIAPGIPHIQNQKTSEMMTRTGFRMNRLVQSEHFRILLYTYKVDDWPIRQIRYGRIN